MPPFDNSPASTARDVARYLLALATLDGDLVSNLKLQKLVYYAYAHALVDGDRKLFSDGIQAWPNGPVVPSLYTELKPYGARPIDEAFLEINSPEEFMELEESFPEGVREILDAVYERYVRLSAFELVRNTHAEKPWREARKGLDPTARSSNVLRDEHIREEFAAPAAG